MSLAYTEKSKWLPAIKMEGIKSSHVVHCGESKFAWMAFLTIVEVGESVMSMISNSKMAGKRYKKEKEFGVPNFRGKCCPGIPQALSHSNSVDL